MDKYLESIEARKQQLKRTENLLPMPIGCVIAALIQVDTTAATTGTASFVCRLRNTHMCLRSPADSSLRYSWATSTSRYLTSEIGECCPNFFIFCCHPPLCKPALVISASLLLARPPEPTTRVLPSPRPASSRAHDPHAAFAGSAWPPTISLLYIISSLLLIWPQWTGALGARRSFKYKQAYEKLKLNATWAMISLAAICILVFPIRYARHAVPPSPSFFFLARQPAAVSYTRASCARTRTHAHGRHHACMRARLA